MTKVCAHRGFSAEYPENTILAFEKAIEAKCDIIEIDIRLTADGEIVVSHDNRLERVSNGTGFVEYKTLAELKALDFSGKFVGKYGIVPIATFREFLTLLKGTGVIANIEIKSEYSNYVKLENDAIAMIREMDMTEQCMFSSFNHYTIKLCRSIAPELECGILYGYDNEYDHIKRAIDVGAKYIHPHYKWMTPENVAYAKANNIGINVWTVDGEDDIKKMIAYGVDSIITNKPDLCRAIVDSL